MKMNKKGIAPIIVVAGIVLFLIVIYIVLQIPIRPFEKIRNLINYILILILWITLQVGVVYAYFQLGKLAVMGYRKYRDTIGMTTNKIKTFLASRG